jgi:hypothetical protein
MAVQSRLFVHLIEHCIQLAQQLMDEEDDTSGGGNPSDAVEEDSEDSHAEVEVQAPINGWDHPA